MNSNTYPKELEQVPSIRRYLSLASKKIRSPELKKQVEAEILSHIESSLYEQNLDGVSFDSALQNVLENLGDAEKLGADLFEANLAFYLRKRFYVPVISLLAIMILFVASVEYYSSRAKSLLSDRISKTEDALASFLNESNDVQNIGLFAHRVDGRDFGPFINNKILWTTDPSQKVSEIMIDQSVRDKLAYLGDSWIEQRHKFDIDDLDLSWMDQLHEFDYWDLYQSGPAQGFEKTTECNPFSLPVPNYLTFADFGKLAHLNGIRTGDLVGAIRKVENFSRLMYSNETLIGGIIAISMLKSNLQAYQYGQKANLLPPGFSLSYSREKLEKAQRVLRARADFFDFTNSAALLKSVFPADSVPQENFALGLCHALDEGARAMTTYHRFFNGKFPYESEHLAKLEYTDNVMNASKERCRIKPARFFWDNRDKIPDLSKAISVSYDPWRDAVLRLAAKLPYTREAVGAMLMAVARPVFSEYESAGK